MALHLREIPHSLLDVLKFNFQKKEKSSSTKKGTKDTTKKLKAVRGSRNSNKCSKEKESFLKNINITGETDVQQVLEFVLLDMTLYGKEEETVSIKEMTGNSIRCDTQKNKVYNDFYNILKCHKTLCGLAKVEKNKRRLFKIICGGDRNEDKKYN